MNEYEAKFAREAKAHPTCWIIVPNDRRTGYRLQRIAMDPEPKIGDTTKVPYLRVVK